MWVFVVWVWVWVSASQRIPLLAREISHETGRRQGKKGPRVEENKPEQRSGQNRAVSRREQATASTCGLRGRVGQRERMSQRSWWLCWNFARIHARDSLQIHEVLSKSVTNFSLLALGVNPSPWLFVLLFFYPLSCVCCVLCVRKEIWNTPGRRWEKPLDDLMAMSGLGGWDSGVRPAVYCHKYI